MHAITLDGYGGVDVLRWTIVPDPVPGPGEVVVEVVASAVNRADLLQRQGQYSPPPGESEILGLECSGRISALGEGVTEWSVGDEVCALLAGGGYAERVAVPAGQCMPVPASIPLGVAGCLPEVACTVHANLGMLAHLQAGETLLVHGGAGGIGTFAIQYGVALGARVAVTAGSPEKLERCRALGAEVLVNYREQDFVDIVGKADIVLDNMGAKYLARNIDVLAPDGRIVVIGLQGGTKAEINLAGLLHKRGALFATSLRGRPRPQKAEICAAVVANVWPLVERGAIRHIVDRTFAMADVAEAHRWLESGDNVGKVLLRG